MSTRRQAPTYTVTTADQGKLVTINNAAAVTVNLPSTAPAAGWWIDFQNTGAGTATLSPNGRNLDGSTSSLTLTTTQGIRIVSDGTNYFSQRGGGGASANATQLAGNAVQGGTPAAGQVLTWNGSAWTATTQAPSTPAILASWCAGAGPSNAGRYYNLSPFGAAAGATDTQCSTGTVNSVDGLIPVPMTSAGTLKNLYVYGSANATNNLPVTLYSSSANIAHGSSTIVSNAVTSNLTAPTASVPITAATCSAGTVTATISGAMPAGLALNQGAVVNVSGLSGTGTWSGSGFTATITKITSNGMFTYVSTSLGTAACSGAATLSSASATFSGAVQYSGTLARISTGSTAHGYSTNDWITISGLNSASFNGVFQITVDDTHTFHYTTAGTAGTTGSGSITATKDATGAGARYDSATGLVTITTTAAHNLLAGEPVTISGVNSGVSGFNGGPFTVVSIPSTTTFTYTPTTAPGNHATGNGGTVSGGIDPTPIMCTVLAGQSRCQDTSHSQAINAGDFVVVVVGPQVAGNDAFANPRVTFEKQ